MATFRSVAGATSTLGNAITVTKPAGTAEGDLLVAWATSGTSSWTTVGAGFTEHSGSLGAAHPLWTKIAGPSEPASYTFDPAGTPSSVVTIVCITGVDTAAPIDAAAGATGTSGNLVLPTVSSAGAGRMLLQCVSKIANIAGWTGPGSQAEAWDTLVGSQSYRTAGGTETVGAGATGTRTWTPASGAATQSGYNVLVASPVVSLAPVGSAHPSSSDTTALTQAHALAPVDSAHADTADSTALTQVHQLTPLDSAQAHTSDAGTLAQVHQLAPDDSTDGHSTDPGSLTQAHQTTPGDSTLTHTTDSVTLAQVHELHPTASTHAHTSTSSSITELAADGYLTPASSRHTHTAAAPVLGQLHQLAPASALNGHLSGSPALTAPLTPHPDRIHHVPAENRHSPVAPEPRQSTVAPDPRTSAA